MESKTILITGGDGFCGQHAAVYFRKQGYRVIATSRKTKNANTYQIDLLNKWEVNEMMKLIQPDFILHLAGQNDVKISWKEPLLTFETNAMITVYLLEAVKTYCPNAKAVIVTSILEESINPYGFSKKIQHEVSKKWSDYFHLNVVIAKPVNLIGPGFSKGVCAKFARKIVFAESTDGICNLRISNLNAKRDFLDVRDAIAAYELLLLKGESGKTYDVGTGKLNTLLEIVNAFMQLTPATLVYIDEHQPIKETACMANPLPLKSLGWKPRYTLIESLSDCLDFFRKLQKAGEDIGG